MKNTKRYWENRLPYSWKLKTKKDYEEMRNFRFTLQDYMLNVFPWKEWNGKRILEIGGGVGIDSIEFEDNGGIVTTTDYTSKAIKHIVHLKKMLNKKLNVAKCSGTNLPFKKSSFDLVYSFGVLHHIPDVEKAVNEIYRVLDNKGKIWIMLYHRDSFLYNYSIIFLRGIIEGRLGKYSHQELFSKFSEYKQDCPHSKAYTISEAEHLFRKFNNIKIETHYNVYDTLIKRKNKIPFIPDGDRAGFHLIVKGEK